MGKRLMVNSYGQIHEECPDCRGECCKPYESAPAAETPRPTIAGLPIVSDAKIPPNTVEIRSGSSITRIENIGSASTGGEAGQEALAICPVCERSVDRMCDAKAVQRGNDWYHGPCSRFASRSTPAAQMELEKILERLKQIGWQFDRCDPNFSEVETLANKALVLLRSLSATVETPSERTLDEELAEFEKWANAEELDLMRMRVNGVYRDETTVMAWQAWLAARGKETR